LCGEHLQEFYTVYLTRFRTYKIGFTTPNKNLGGKGFLRQINTCRQIPLQVNFLRKDDLRVWCLYSYLVRCSEAGCDESGRGEVARGRSRRLVRGSVYRYQCEEGAVLRGSELAFCDGERWSSDPPTCIGKDTSVTVFYLFRLLTESAP
jgi:hypothetical protein